MFKFLCFAVAATTHIALELSLKPSLINSSEVLIKNADKPILQGAETNHKNTISYFITENYKISLNKTIKKDQVYAMHNYFEKEFEMDNFHFVKKQENGLYLIEGLETPVNKEALGCLYYDALLRNPGTSSQVPIKLNVSSRDYYDEEQIKEISNLFRNIRFITRVIPESLAIILEKIMVRKINASYKDFVLNFRGSQPNLSTFETTIDSKTFKVENKQNLPLKNLSDYEIERIIYKHLKGILSKIQEGVALLPFEDINETHQYYCDISEIVTMLCKPLIMPDYTQLIPDFPYYSISTGGMKRFNSVTVSMNDLIKDIDNAFSTEIKEIQKIIDSEDYKEYGQKFISTDIPFIATLFKNVTHIPSMFIVNGLQHAFDESFELVDSRISNSLSGSFNRNESYLKITKEMAYMSGDKSELADLPNKIGTFEFVPETDKKDFLEKYNSVEIMKSSYSVIKSIKDRFNQLESYNKKHLLEKQKKTYAMTQLEMSIKEAESFLPGDESVESTGYLKNAYNKAVEWHNASKKIQDSVTYSDIDKQVLNLNSIIIFHRKKLDKIQADKKLEESKKLEEKREDKKLEGKAEDEMLEKDFQEYFNKLLKEEKPDGSGEAVEEALKKLKDFKSPGFLETLKKGMLENMKKSLEDKKGKKPRKLKNTKADGQNTEDLEESMTQKDYRELEKSSITEEKKSKEPEELSRDILENLGENRDDENKHLEVL